MRVSAARSSTPTPWGLVALGLVGSALAVVPIVYLLRQAIAEGATRVADELWQRRTLDLAARSVGLALTVTAVCVVVGVSAAWLVERSDLPGRRWLRIVLAMPLAIPSYLAAHAWISWRPSLAGFWGAALVLSSVSYPFVFLPVVAALRRLDPAHDEVARSLGRRPWRVALGVTIPLIRPSIAAGALLVALYVLSDFGAVASMRYEVFTWVIYGAYRAGFDPSRAAILAMILLLLALVVVAGEARARGRAVPTRVGRGAPRPPVAVRLGRGSIAAWALLAAVLGAALVFPIVRVVTWAVSYHSTNVEVADVGRTLGATLWLSVLAALVTLLVAIPVGALAARHRGLLARLVERSTYVAHALPGIVIAISLVYVGVRLVRPIYLRTPLLVAGYAVLFLPLAVASVRASVEQSPLVFDEQARSLGSSRWGAFTKVTLPLAAPGLLAGWALVMLSTMKELPVTLVLRPTATHTLASRLWAHTAVSDYGNAGPYALALIVFAAVPTALLSVSIGRRGEQVGT